MTPTTTPHDLNAIDDIRRRQLETINREMAARITRVHDSLTQDNVHVTSVLPERIFVNYFLPFFAGQTEANESDHRLSEWIGVAGTPMSPVSIIDEQGREIYRVPPYFDTALINIRPTVQKSFHTVNIEAAAYQNNLPILGERYIADALDTKLQEIVDEVEVSKTHEEQWLDIFKRYGIQVDTNAVTTSIIDASESSDFGI